ncbi:hypothetical protein CI102_2926 [Trichoderma harzianum]|nr:hypothetical protein CI102_2926 [Trichoderma harzianum]
MPHCNIVWQQAKDGKAISSTHQPHRRQGPLSENKGEQKKTIARIHIAQVIFPRGLFSRAPCPAHSSEKEHDTAIQTETCPPPPPFLPRKFPFARALSVATILKKNTEPRKKEKASQMEGGEIRKKITRSGISKEIYRKKETTIKQPTGTPSFTLCCVPP